jgi:hypothetical protein
MYGSAKEVNRSSGAIRMAWVPPRTPNDLVTGSLCERAVGAPTLGEILALNAVFLLPRLRRLRHTNGAGRTPCVAPTKLRRSYAVGMDSSGHAIPVSACSH